MKQLMDFVIICILNFMHAITCISNKYTSRVSQKVHEPTGKLWSMLQMLIFLHVDRYVIGHQALK